MSAASLSLGRGLPVTNGLRMNNVIKRGIQTII
jgi:hypothetical protein